jgi:hypothetical protein
MTEADVESIWDTTWDTTRFGKIGVRIAEVLNFLISGDATTQVTSTAVTPILEQISEEILFELANAAKANKFSDIWQFISANISKIDWESYDTYLLKKVRRKLAYTKPELTRRVLPSSTTDW